MRRFNHIYRWTYLILFYAFTISRISAQTLKDYPETINSFDTTTVNKQFIEQYPNTCNKLLLNSLSLRKLSDSTRKRSEYNPGQNYPNPFCCSLLFDVVNIQDSVTLKIFDLKGIRVSTKHFGLVQHGRYIINYEDIPCKGILFIQFTIGNEAPYTRKIQKL